MPWKDFYVVLVFSTLTAVTTCDSVPETKTMSAKCKIQTNRPIIGVLAQSTEDFEFRKFGKTYIGASYIKYLESSGARVVPIMDNLSELKIEKLFKSINGVLLPGGIVSLTSSGYARTGRIIYNLAKKSNEQGNYFPLWGTCLGFQYLLVVESGTIDVKSRTDSFDCCIPLNFSRDYLKSKMFRDIPNDLSKFLRESATTMNVHNWSITVKDFNKNKKLKNFFNILSVNNDRNGIQFVSAIEAKKYPFYGVQWHPEMNSFTWSLNRTTSHDAMSIKVTQYFSNFFVNEARCSGHKFQTLEEEEDSLIHNYCPTYTAKISRIEQCYIFH